MINLMLHLMIDLVVNNLMRNLFNYYYWYDALPSLPMIHLGRLSYFTWNLRPAMEMIPFAKSQWGHYDLPWFMRWCTIFLVWKNIVRWFIMIYPLTYLQRLIFHSKLFNYWNVKHTNCSQLRQGTDLLGRRFHTKLLIAESFSQEQLTKNGSLWLTRFGWIL